LASQLDLGDLFGDIDRLIAAADDTAKGLDQPGEKQLLSAVVEKLKLARKDAEEIVPAKLEELKTLAESQAARAEELQAELDKMHNEMAERMAAMQAEVPTPPAASPAPEFMPDPALGARLRDELLRRFGPPTGTEPPPFRPGKDIWEDWK
jgi:hypothetical protein